MYAYATRALLMKPLRLRLMSVLRSLFKALTFMSEALAKANHKRKEGTIEYERSEYEIVTYFPPLAGGWVGKGL